MNPEQAIPTPKRTFSPPSFKRTTKRILFAFLALIGIALFVFSRFSWVPAGHVGVIYDASQGILPGTLSPRAVFVGWRQQLYVYPTRLQAAIYTQDPTEGEVKSADGILVTSNDNANTIFDMTVLYRVPKENVTKVFNSFGAIPIEEIQRLHIRRAAREAVNVVGTQYDVFQLMGDKRAEASMKTTLALREALDRKGIEIVSVMLNSCYPSTDIQQKINGRVNSFTELDISRLRRQIAEVERASAITKAQAEATASGLRATQTQTRSVDLLKLEAQAEAIKKWNGKLPAISPRPGQTIVIGSGALAEMGAGK